jgi:hypothetical protein
LPNKSINQILPPFYLGIVQPHIPSEGSATQAILKEMNQQFLIMNHLSHFVAICFKMGYMTLISSIFDKFLHSKSFWNDNIEN